MNFFELQARARRRTWLLLLWMLLAVAGITLAINAVAYMAAVLGGLLGDGETNAGGIALWLEQPIWIWVTTGTLLALLGGSLVRYLTIARGGRAIADMIDARRVDLSTREEHDRRFINVVEEMSIAAGTPRPALYVMEQETAINAFVAGSRPTDAIMVVTRGALDSLSRDELQGVVGHEFSHILNGDMRLNIRLMAIVAGILLFGKVGAFMLRGGAIGSGTAGKRRGGVVRGDARVMLGWYGVGLALLVIGYLGLFCGRLIKAAVSRQREFLADASSVQFTRNPEGISGALWRIGESTGGSLLASAYAEDMSHMCFGQSVRAGFSGLLATHPPIETRLQAIDPQFRARRVARRVREDAPAAAEPEIVAAPPIAAPAVAAGMGFAAGSGIAAAAVSAREVGDSVGNPTPAHADFARDLLGRIPQPVKQAAHEGAGAEALVYALLLGDVADGRLPLALALLGHQTDKPLAERAHALHRSLGPLGDLARLPVLDLAVATLREGDTATRARVVEVADKLTRVDREVSVFEFSLVALLRHHLHGDDAGNDRSRFFRLAPVIGDLRRLLSLLAWAGAEDQDAARTAFARATTGFAGGTLTLASRDQCDASRMHEALARIGMLSPLLKRPVIEACVDCVQHDGRVTLTESELLRAVAASLDCPLPPMLATHTA